MIKFEYVGLRYGVGPEILSDVSFELEPGSFHFLIGPSGAGKTSLMSLLYLGQRPTRGQISMFDNNIGSLNRMQLADIRKRIGIIFQDFRLLPHMSAFENVALPLRIMGKPEREIRNNVEELLQWVGLGDHMNVLPSTLSGGQQQRVAIARAIITRPKLLLADEPTGNLDDVIGLRLMNLFDQLNRMGTTIVIATHNLQLIEKYKFPCMVLNHGSLEISSPTDKAVSQSFEA